MASISIVYPATGRTERCRQSLRPRLLTPNERLSQEICILMGQSYIVLFTLPFSRRACSGAAYIQLPRPAEGEERERVCVCVSLRSKLATPLCTGRETKAGFCVDLRKVESTVFELSPIHRLHQTRAADETGLLLGWLLRHHSRFGIDFFGIFRIFFSFIRCHQ